MGNGEWGIGGSLPPAPALRASASPSAGDTPATPPSSSFFQSLHIHTTFCDGKDDIEAMCRSAHEKKLAAIGFSSHAPVEKAGLSTTWNMKENRLNEYAAEVRAARQRWQGKIDVYLGLEVDYIKGLRSALDSDIQALNLDYSIGSVHFLLPPCAAAAPFTIDGPEAEVETGVACGFSGDGEAMMNAYWDAVLEMIALGGFDIVGHLDLVKRRNAADRFFSTESATWFRRAEEAVRAIAAGGLVAEVNTGGLNRGYFAETCPSLPILRLLRQYNVPVTITADAHKANDLDGHYQTARQTLLEAGYASHVIFQGKGQSWREIPL